MYWDAISYTCTPRILRHLLKTGKLDPILFTRIQNVFYLRMFQTMDRRIQRAQTKQISSQTIWEKWLTQEGFIPVLPKQMISNDRYGFYCNKQKQWTEWTSASISMCRFYWNSLLEDLNESTRHSILTICRKWIQLLPSADPIHQQCTECIWSVPKESMYSDTLCEHCHDCHQSTKLQKHRHMPFLSIAC